MNEKQNLAGLKKNCCNLTPREKLSLIEKNNPTISLSRQAQLLNLSRSSLYYQPIVNYADIAIMNQIDEIYTKYPFYGSRRIKYGLLDEYAKIVNRKHIQRLMRIMGIEAIYPKKNTSLANSQNSTYPYLLINLNIIYPNQVWGTDITYIRLAKGFAYLAVLMDWFSRYVLAWTVSPTLTDDFCQENLNKALTIAIPDIHNSDQGSQFTSNEYLKILNDQDIKVSMDSRGRCMDNIFNERLWRSVKYEDIYIKNYETLTQLNQGLANYFQFYNNKRRHQGINNQTPARVYFKKS